MRDAIEKTYESLRAHLKLETGLEWRFSSRVGEHKQPSGAVCLIANHEGTLLSVLEHQREGLHADKETEYPMALDLEASNGDVDRTGPYTSRQDLIHAICQTTGRASNYDINQLAGKKLAQVSEVARDVVLGTPYTPPHTPDSYARLVFTIAEAIITETERRQSHYEREFRALEWPETARKF